MNLTYFVSGFCVTDLGLGGRDARRGMTGCKYGMGWHLVLRGHASDSLVSGFCVADLGLGWGDSCRWIVCKYGMELG